MAEKATVLLEYIDDCRAPDSTGATVLHLAAACATGTVIEAIVQRHIAAGGAADSLCLSADQHGDTALHYLARTTCNLRSETVALHNLAALCAVCPSAAYHAINRRGETALHVAAAYGRPALVRQLLQLAPEVTYLQTADALTPLHYVAAYGRDGVAPRPGEPAQTKTLDGIAQELLKVLARDSQETESAAVATAGTDLPHLRSVAAQESLRTLLMAMEADVHAATRLPHERPDAGVSASLAALSMADGQGQLLEQLGGERKALLTGALQELSMVWENMSASIDDGSSVDDENIIRRLAYGPFGGRLTASQDCSSSVASMLQLFRGVQEALQPQFRLPANCWLGRGTGLYIGASAHSSGTAPAECVNTHNVFEQLKTALGLAGGDKIEHKLFSVRYLKQPAGQRLISELASVRPSRFAAWPVSMVPMPALVGRLGACCRPWKLRRAQRWTPLRMSFVGLRRAATVQVLLSGTA